MASDATCRVTIETAGDYRLWLRILGPSRSSDALYIGVDRSFDRVFTGSIGDYEWVRVEEAIALTGGEHTIRLGYGEPLARADRIVLTNDPSFAPSGATGMREEGP